MKLSQGPPPPSNPFGGVAPPPGVSEFSGGSLSGLSSFISVIIKTLIVGAGVYAVFNIISAGYTFLSAGGDPKKIADAWGKITQSLLGLTFAAGALVIAAIVGRLLFGNANALLQLQVFGP